MSTRQLLRIASRLRNFPTTNEHDVINDVFMVQFLPSLARQALEKTIESVIGVTNDITSRDDKIKCYVKNDVLTIGETSIPIDKTTKLSKVPDILFYDVPQHIHLMEKMLQDFMLGQHLLLVGNQGVGKNKIVDR